MNKLRNFYQKASGTVERISSELSDLRSNVSKAVNLAFLGVGIASCASTSTENTNDMSVSLDNATVSAEDTIDDYSEYESEVDYNELEDESELVNTVTVNQGDTLWDHLGEASTQAMIDHPEVVDTAAERAFVRPVSHGKAILSATPGWKAVSERVSDLDLQSTGELQRVIADSFNEEVANKFTRLLASHEFTTSEICNLLDAESEDEPNADEDEDEDEDGVGAAGQSPSPTVSNANYSMMSGQEYIAYLEGHVPSFLARFGETSGVGLHLELNKDEDGVVSPTSMSGQEYVGNVGELTPGVLANFTNTYDLRQKLDLKKDEAEWSELSESQKKAQIKTFVLERDDSLFLKSPWDDDSRKEAIDTYLRKGLSPRALEGEIETMEYDPLKVYQFTAVLMAHPETDLNNVNRITYLNLTSGVEYEAYLSRFYNVDPSFIPVRRDYFAEKSMNLRSLEQNVFALQADRSREIQLMREILLGRADSVKKAIENLNEAERASKRETRIFFNRKVNRFFKANQARKKAFTLAVNELGHTTKEAFNIILSEYKSYEKEDIDAVIESIIHKSMDIESAIRLQNERSAQINQLPRETAYASTSKLRSESIMSRRSSLSSRRSNYKMGSSSSSVFHVS